MNKPVSEHARDNHKGLLNKKLLFSLEVSPGMPSAHLLRSSVG